MDICPSMDSYLHSQLFRATHTNIRQNIRIRNEALSEEVCTVNMLAVAKGFYPFEEH